MCFSLNSIKILCLPCSQRQITVDFMSMENYLHSVIQFKVKIILNQKWNSIVYVWIIYYLLFCRLFTNFFSLKYAENEIFVWIKYNITHRFAFFVGDTRMRSQVARDVDLKIVTALKLILKNLHLFWVVIFTTLIKTAHSSLWICFVWRNCREILPVAQLCSHICDFDVKFIAIHKIDNNWFELI